MYELLYGLDKYCKKSTWATFAMLKTCVLSIGLLFGMVIPSKAKKAVAIIATIVFVATYIPLMIDFVRALVGDDD